MHKEILVIDDNPDIRYLICNILKEQNFEVRSAANYDQALLEINKRLPELDMLEQPLALTVVFGGVLFLGIGITGVSTFFATQRYLNLKSDAIY